MVWGELRQGYSRRVCTRYTGCCIITALAQRQITENQVKHYLMAGPLHGVHCKGTGVCLLYKQVWGGGGVWGASPRNVWKLAQIAHLRWAIDRWIWVARSQLVVVGGTLVAHRWQPSATWRPRCAVWEDALRCTMVFFLSKIQQNKCSLNMLNKLNNWKTVKCTTLLMIGDERYYSLLSSIQGFYYKE